MAVIGASTGWWIGLVLGIVVIAVAAAIAELQSLHGDKAVWKLLDRYADAAVDVHVGGAIPRDVDTWEDYQALRTPSQPESGAHARK